MDHRNTIDKAYFRCVASASGLRDRMRTHFLKLRGAKIGKGTIVPNVLVTWPHQISIGSNCGIEAETWFRHDGWNEPGPNIIVGSRTFIGRGCQFLIKSSVRIGDDCNIATGCKFIDFDHTVEDGTQLISRQPCVSEPIILESDVWLGVNVVVLKGLVIGRGAVVGAGAVVTKSIPPYEIWAGVPAKRIGRRNVVTPSDYSQSRLVTKSPAL